MSPNPLRKRSVLWHVLPAVFSIIGGAIAYFILKNKDHSKAKNCLWLGIPLTAFYAAYYIVFY
jgi:cytochrome bd-type quinol oxidase subunit 1